MSAASRSKVRARARHREQVARAIAELELGPDVWCGMCQGLGYDLDIMPDEVDCKLCKGSGSGRVVLAIALLSDPEQGFDVHAARERAKALVLYGRHAHPELPSTLDTVPRLTGHDEQHVRLGRRILDMLDGERGRPGSAWLHAPYQPSECQGGCWPSFPAGKRKIDHEVMGDPQGGASTCPACRGTGHNLRGSLPPVEWSPQLRRKYNDCVEADVEKHIARPQWLMEIGLGPVDLFTRTRVTPRGTHRDELKPGSLSWMPKGSPRMWVSECDECLGDGEFDYPVSNPRPCPHCEGLGKRVTMRHLAPRWRRGELRHAEQRRRKEAAAWKMVRGRRLALEATTLLQEWLDGYERAGIRPEMTPTWLADAENYIASHHSQPDAVTLRFDGEARSIVAGVTLAPSIEPLTIRCSFEV